MSPDVDPAAGAEASAVAAPQAEPTADLDDAATDLPAGRLPLEHDDEPDDHGGEPPDDDLGVPPSYLRLRRARRVLWTAVAVALPVAMLVAVLATRPSAESRSVKSPLVGKPAPAAEGTTVDGQHARLADLQGRWVIVNFFATWCVPCQDEHPDLVRFSQAHRGVADASVFGVVYSDSPSAVKDFRAEKGGDWPLLTDPDGRIALDYGVAGVPESFLVSPERVIVAKILGGVKAEQLEGLLDKARRGGS